MKPMGLLQTTSSNKRFEVISVDLFEPLPQTEDGFQWILIAEDVASRWVEIFPLREATSEVCAKTLIAENVNAMRRCKCYCELFLVQLRFERFEVREFSTPSL